MIGASKILTVSYGTFSCTLEGFDEPFNTMKAIAEYFRDLAADDRYFGAEPPTPDAAMLHKIAEREIHRRVDAKIQENGVILRTGDALDAPVPSTAVTAAPKLTDLIDYDDQPLLSDASVSADSVAAKLSRLRATAAAAIVSAPVSAVTIVPYAAEIAPLHKPEAPVIDSITSEIALDDQTLAEDDFDADEFAEINWAPDAPKEPVDLIADQAEIAVFSDQIEDTADLPDAADQDVLDDLARLDGDAAEYDDQLPLIEPIHHQPPVDDQPAVFAAVGPQAALRDPAEDTLAADDALLASLESRIATTDQSDRQSLNDEFEDEFEDEFDGFEDSFAVDAQQTDIPASHLPASDLPDENDRANAKNGAAKISVQGADDAPDDVVEPEIVQRARARVIKIRRADAPALIAEAAVASQPSLLSDEAEAALLAELAALEAEAAPLQPSDTLQADVEDDASFDAELDRISAEISADAPPVPVRPQRPVRSISVARFAAESAGPVTPADAKDTTQGFEGSVYSQSATDDLPIAEDIIEPRRDIENDLADEAVGRLMAQTNSALDGEDVKRRQSAIAHLKAAVAATEADRLIAPNQPKDDLTESYRSDLESAVRPMRPASGEAGVANADRPQPLVLVSAQRIDRPFRSETAPRPDTAPRIVAPVRPRRIVAGGAAAAPQDSILGSGDFGLDEDEGIDDAAINMFAETESFADFADRLGASDLPDLLEAAAVYCASVLGRPEFSRPLVLRQVATLPATADLSREDGLRVFGTLMRQGRITRTRRGQFAVTDRSPILAEALRSAS